MLNNKLMIFKLVRTLILILGLGLIFWFLTIILKIDYSTEIPKENKCTIINNFKLYPHLSGLDKSNLTENFPYAIYVDSANKCNIKSILNDLVDLDSFNSNDPNTNRRIISIALTQKLEEKIRPIFNSYNPDSLISIMQWAEKFNNYQEFDQTNEKLFRVIYKHWVNFVANKLGEYYDNTPKHKYDFKFKYLVSICQSKDLSPPVGNTDREKVFLYLINKDFSYLFNKFWTGTSFLYKIIGLIFLIVTCYGYYCIYKVNFKKE